MKKIGILGTGMVGQTIGKKLISLGYEVKMGSRTANNEKAAKWAAEMGSKAGHGTFGDAALAGEIIFLCTKGEATIDIVKLGGVANFEGKVVIDVSNPLDFSKGMPPSLFVCNNDSLGERVQHTIPGAKVVKTLNIVNCEVMVNPAKSGGKATMFLCGNDAAAKKETGEILKQFGWDDQLDLGDITSSRALEMMLPVWLRIYMSTNNGYVAFKVVR